MGWGQCSYSPFAHRPSPDKGRRLLFPSLLCLVRVSPAAPICGPFSLHLSRDLDSMFRGLSPFLFPWRFRLRACLVVLMAGLRRAWPIQLQALSDVQTFDSSAATPRRYWCCQASVFGGSFSDIWTFFAVFTVFLQLSAPYSSIDFPLELNSRILVLVDRYLDVHICRKAVLALLTQIFYRQMSFLVFQRCCQDRRSFPPLQAHCLQN